MKRCEYFGHFIFLMILVLVLVMLLAYNNYKSIARTVPGTSEKFGANVPASIEERVDAVFYAMHETATSRVLNLTDVNTTYQLWYSNMNRRGLPDYYITPSVFEQLYDLVMKSEFTAANVEKVIRPCFDHEVELAKVPNVNSQFVPVCLNY